MHGQTSDAVPADGCYLRFQYLNGSDSRYWNTRRHLFLIAFYVTVQPTELLPLFCIIVSFCACFGLIQDMEFCCDVFRYNSLSMRLTIISAGLRISWRTRKRYSGKIHFREGTTMLVPRYYERPQRTSPEHHAEPGVLYPGVGLHG